MQADSGGAAPDCEFSVSEHIVNAFRRLFRPVIGSRATNACGIEDYQVGIIAGAHQAPITQSEPLRRPAGDLPDRVGKFHPPPLAANGPDRKSTRLNSSHLVISYAVF